MPQVIRLSTLNFWSFHNRTWRCRDHFS